MMKLASPKSKTPTGKKASRKRLLQGKHRQKVGRRQSRIKHSERKQARLENGERKNVLNRIIENRLIKEISYEQYRDKVRGVYDGPQGAILATCSMLSLHTPLGDRMFRERHFDLRGAKNILDVGSGAGQIVKHVLKYADTRADITCFDLSHEMLRRARNRLKDDRPRLVVADLASLPFGDNSFDTVTCGYVLEHLPDPRDGLAELARVMTPGAQMLLLTTEDNFSGAWTSRMWRCRTYNRAELRRTCTELGLRWDKELWFTKMHKVFRAGGICVRLVKE
ncbi:MAG: class I SAM-dependent methyltransferase [Pirellulales bacterium]|nr:class I SAM-dependent methyltransferase [Pirellulales bacterium]